MRTYLEIKSLDDHTWVISEGKGNGRSHCYLLEGENKAVLIDSGLGLVNMKKIVSSLTSKEIWVINTHGHFDHIGRNYQFEKVWIHPNDVDLLIKHSNQKFRYEIQKARYIRKGYPKLFVCSFLFKLYTHSLWFYPRISKCMDLVDNSIIDLGNRSLKIIVTSGHTQGSICILDESRNWLFCGDTICEKGVLLNFEESTSIKEYLNSLMKLKKEVSNNVKLYAGHQMIPLDESYIDDYIGCANTIINNQCEKIVQYQKAKITYDFSKKN